MIKEVLGEFWSFLKKPNDIRDERIFLDRIKIIFIFLGLEILFLGLVLTPIDYIVSEFVHQREKFDYKYDEFWMSLFGAILLAPIFEELFYRFILRRQGLIEAIFSQKNWDKMFPYLVYISAILFGFIHLGNYTNDSVLFYVFSPIIIGSQLVGGFVITFIRVRFHILWAIFYHALWNTFVTLVMIVTQNVYPPYEAEAENYTLKISEKYFYDKDKGKDIKIDSSNGKIYKMQVEQYSFQHLLDTLYQKDRYHIDDIFIQLKLESKKGVTKTEFLDILREEYYIE